MSTPYLLPPTLKDLPTGVQWNSIPANGSSDAAQYAAQLELCRAASRWADATCNMPLHATADTEELTAPGPYAIPDGNGILWVTPRRKPVLSVASIELRSNIGQTTDYTAIEANRITILTNAGADELAAGSGSTRIRVIGTGIVKGVPFGAFSLRLTYVNGWANSELSTASTAGATSITLADATGFAVGDTIEIVDTSLSEDTTISAIAGTTLTVDALTYAHDSGVQVTELPANIRYAAAWYAAHLALFRGSSAMAIPVAGVRHTTSASKVGETNYLELAQLNLMPYRRVW